MEIVVWCSCGLVGLAGWWWLLRRTPRYSGGEAPAGEWHAGDAVFGCVLALYLILGVFADDGKSIAITPEAIKNGTFFYLTIVILFSALVFARGQTPQRAFGLAPARPLRVVGLGILCVVLTYPLVQLAELIVSKFGFSASDGDEMVRYLRGPLSGSDTAWAVALAAVVAPLTEELVFRGYLYGVLKKYGGQLAAMFTSALLFAAIHHNLPAMPALFVLAVGFTLAYELTGSLWAPISMHVVFNLSQAIVILWFPQWIPKP